MRITLNKAAKAIQFWITAEESINPNTKAEISAIASRYAAEKYKTVIFISGKKNFLDTTINLLKNNTK